MHLTFDKQYIHMSTLVNKYIWLLSTMWVMLSCVLSGLYFYSGGATRWEDYILAVCDTQRIRAAINQSSLYNYNLFCVLNSKCNNPGWVSLLHVPTTCTAAVVRMYKKTSAAVCERPRGPELCTMSPIVCASHSPTVWHWNNRCPNAGFLAQRRDVSVGREPRLGPLIFIIMICYIFCCNLTPDFGLYADPLREN